MAKYLVIWGDSHADHMVGAFEVANTLRPLVILPRWRGACPPLTGAVPVERNAPDERCNQFNSAVLAEIAQLRKLDRLSGVVLGARWSIYLGKPSLVGEDGVALWHGGRVVMDEAAAAALEDGLSLTLQKLTELNVEVLVIAPVPEQRFEVPLCLARRSVESCSVSRALAEDQRRVALQAINESIDRFENVYLWDPLPTLCNDGVCLAKREGIIVYTDDEHLTYRGSRWLGPYLARSVAWRAVLGAEKVCPYDASAAVGGLQPIDCRPTGTNRTSDQRNSID